MTMANATRSLTTLPDELQLQICEAFLAGRKVNIIVAKEREVGDILQLTRYGLTQFSSNNNAAPLATSRQIQDVMSKLLRKDEKLFIFDASIIPVLACRDIAMVETKLREQITCVRTPEVRTLPYQQIIRLFPRLRRVEVGNDAAFNSEILATLKEIGQDRALVLLNASNDDIAHAVEAKVWDLLGISPPMHVEILVSVSIPTQALQDGNQFKFPGQNLVSPQCSFDAPGAFDRVASFD